MQIALADFPGQRVEVTPIVVSIEVLGTPASKGNARAMTTKTGKAVLVPAYGEKLKSWDHAVREAARDAIGNVERPPFIDMPLRVTVEFRLVRPAGHYGKNGVKANAPKTPHKKPDIDKLLRATLDPLIATVFDDDSRIVSVTMRKVYASPGNEGATIMVEEM